MIRYLTIVILLCGHFLMGPTAQARNTIQDNADIPEIFMDQALIAQADTTLLIQTAGALTCLVITLWDPVTKMGAIAHISAQISIAPSMDKIKREFEIRGVPAGRLQARIVGGLKGWSERMVNELKTFIKRSKIQLVENDTLFDAIDLSPTGLMKKNVSKVKMNQAFTLSLQTGELFNHEETISVQKIPPPRPWGSEQSKSLDLFVLSLS